MTGGGDLQQGVSDVDDVVHGAMAESVGDVDGGGRDEDDPGATTSAGTDAAAGGEGVESVLPDLDETGAHGDGLELSPEAAVVDSLNSALRQLRESADRLEDMPLDDAKVSAAEQVAESAAELDEQIGTIARMDED